jgi:hypothetical protein
LLRVKAKEINIMAKGSKASYTSKQRRQAHHIEESESKRGMDPKRAAQIGYATVNKESGGGKKSGSGRGKTVSQASSRKGGRIGGAQQAARMNASRKSSRSSASRTR